MPSRLIYASVVQLSHKPEISTITLSKLTLHKPTRSNVAAQVATSTYSYLKKFAIPAFTHAYRFTFGVSDLINIKVLDIGRHCRRISSYQMKEVAKSIDQPRMAWSSVVVSYRKMNADWGYLVGLEISHFTSNVTSTSIIFKNKQVVYNYSRKISSNQIEAYFALSCIQYMQWNN